MFMYFFIIPFLGMCNFVCYVCGVISICCVCCSYLLLRCVSPCCPDQFESHRLKDPSHITICALPFLPVVSGTQVCTTMLSLLLQSWLFETDSLDGLVTFTTQFCIKYIHYIIPELVIKQSVAQQNAGVPILCITPL